MKIWLKLLIGIIVGIVLTLILPPGKYFSFISEIVINVGRYVIFPLVLFSLIIGTYELREQKKLFHVYSQTFLYLILSTVILVIIGVLSIFLFSQFKLENTAQEQSSINIPGFKETMLTVFPQNLFSAIVTHGDFLLPVVVFAIIFGATLTYDKMVTRPILQLVDSLSRVFYQINSLIAEIFYIGIIAVTAAVLFSLKSIPDITFFQPLIIILSIDTIIVLFGIYPGLLYLFGERKNPYKWLYSMTGPLLTAFVTGDQYLATGMLTKHAKENMGIPRQVNSAIFSVFAIFGRAGSSMVAVVSFIAIMKSMTAQDIPFLDILWVMCFSFIASFALGSVPGMSAYIAISLISDLYGKLLPYSYLIVLPIVPLLVGFGALLDIATAGFTSFLITHQKEVKFKIEAKDFI